MGFHQHQPPCKHETVKHCAHCDVAYCTACGREWGNGGTWTYSWGNTTAPINTYVSGNLGYAIAGGGLHSHG